MRIAFFSPLNPKRSGISDYSEELLPYLAKLATVDLVTDNYAPADEALSSRHAVLSPEAFLKQAGQYDQVIYQIGNSLEYHGYMVACLEKVPGIVVLHDYSLGYLILGLTMARGDSATIEQILGKTMPAAQASALKWKLLLGQLDSYSLSLARPIVEMASGVIVHNRFALNRLQSEYPDAKARLIWHATPIREELGNKALLRKQYGFAGEDFLIVSVSRLAYNKRIDIVLRCLARVVEKNQAVRLVLVGEGELGARARSLIARHQLERHVVRTGWVDAAAYQDYIDMADAAIDLRHPTAGETSGGSLRLLQAGKPIIATAQGFFLELPAQCCILVQPGSSKEEEQVVAALEKLSTDEEYRNSMGQAARQFAMQYLRREQAAEQYIDFCNEIAAEPGPVRGWRLPQPPVSQLMRLIYNWGRVVQFARKYGFAGLVARLKRSL